MILYWAKQRYAEEKPFGKNISGVTHDRERPTIILIPKEELKEDLFSLQYLLRASEATKLKDPRDIIIY